MNIKNILNKGKEAIKSGVDKGVKNSKELYELSKKRAKSEIHKQTKKVALDVIDKTIRKANSPKEKMHLKASEEIVEKVYEKGGKVSRDNFYESISQLSEEQKRGLAQELDKNNIIVNEMDFYELSKGNKNKAKTLMKNAYYEANKKAYEKYGIKYTKNLYGSKNIYEKGGHVGKGELVWSKLSNSAKADFLRENFTPLITPRTQESLVGKAYNFLPKSVKIKFEAKYADVEEYERGGSISEYKIVEGHDHLNNKPLHKVISTNEDNDYVGEWHTNRDDAEEELKGLSEESGKRGSIGFIPMDLEEDLMYISNYGGISIKETINILNAIVDSGLTKEELAPKLPKSTKRHREIRDKKTKEVWSEIEKYYKGNLKGNQYFQVLHDIISKDINIIDKFKPYRKYQKFEHGGTLQKDEFDWNKLFEPLSPKEQEELLLKLKKEEKDTITNEKNILVKNIKAKGSNWNEAFIFRVKSARHSISKFIEWAKKKDYNKANDWFNDALEHIESIKELGYEAKRYGNSMEKRLRNYYDELYIKNKSNPKYEKGGEIEGSNIGTAKRTKVKNWYIKNYPTDDLGKEIDDKITFWSLYTMISQGYDVYSLLGVSDSLLRERVFKKLSTIIGIEYNVIYNKWLKGNKYEKGGKINNGEYGAIIDWQNFTLNELNEFLKYWSIGKGEIEINLFAPKGIDYVKYIDYKKHGDEKLSVGDIGKQAKITKGRENIYLDITVYNEKNEEYTIGLYSKENHNGLKEIAQDIIVKFEKGGTIKTNNMTQEQIEKLVGIAKSTNKVASEIATKKLKEAGLDANGNEIKSKEPKKVIIKTTKAPTSTPKTEPKKTDTLKKADSSSEPDCDDLYKQYKKRQIAQKKAKQAPQKRETTKNKEKIEKVEDSLDLRFKAGKLTKNELQKMYNETKALLEKIKKYLDKL